MKIVAVFVAPTWTDQARLRLWAKTLEAVDMVLLTDDLSDGNVVIARQLKCSEIICALVRTPGVMRSLPALEGARRARDAKMALLASTIYDFGELPGGSERFVCRRTIVAM
jgi:hypothetical protein